jgi:SAM-dependent methyltransferase
MISKHKFKDALRDVRRAIQKRTRLPGVGQVDLGSLDRVTPVSSNWGFDRGQAVDRFYIEKFLENSGDLIAGDVLEVADNTYTRRFGSDRIKSSEILHDSEGHSRATLIVDISKPDSAPTDRFDCIICTQTLQLIYDLSSAFCSLNMMLKPGGTLLLTVPGITAISREDMDRHGDFWRFTTASLDRLLREAFDPDSVSVEAFGNVYSATAFLHGLAVEELDNEKLVLADPDYQMLLAARAQKRIV